MLWIAVIYSLVAMGLTHLIGRPLVSINFNRLRVEADFRYRLVRFRDNAEAVALAQGAAFEQTGALARFSAVIDNWWQLIAAQRNLNLFTAAIGQVNGVVPLLMAAPAYFAGWITLGSVLETRVAYGQVSGALAWFVYAYQEIAQWRASVERLSTLADVVDAAEADLSHPEGIQHDRVAGDKLRLVNLSLQLPDGRVLLDPINATVSTGERVVVLGGVGVGKTALFRALAGIWPFGSGRIEMPTQARAMFLMQRAYLPIGTLREVVSYPAAADAFSEDKVCDVLRLLDLKRFEAHLHDKSPWDQQLTDDEQQRLTIARVLLHEPDWIFMDDATAALDEAMERRVYEMLQTRLPAATVVSLTHRAAVLEFHTRRWRMSTNDQGRATLHPI
jgi:putative ATP-binding cassette transporter